jgi:hypothetical protein
MEFAKTNKVLGLDIVILALNFFYKRSPNLMTVENYPLGTL